MAYFKLPKEFTPGYSTTKKPTIPVEIDWLHPSARGLKAFFCIVDGQIVDLVQGVVGSSANPLPTTIKDGHESKYFNADSYYQFDEARWDGDPSGQTILTKCSRNATGTKDYYTKGAAAPNGWALDIDDQVIFTVGGGVKLSTAANALPSTNTLYDICLYIDNTGGSIYVDNVDATSTSSAYTYSGDNDSTLNIGGNGSNIYKGHFVHLIHFDRHVSAQERTNLTKEPYQLLKPKLDVYWFTSTAVAAQAPLPLPKEFTPGFSTTEKPTIPVETDPLDAYSQNLQIALPLQGSDIDGARGARWSGRGTNGADFIKNGLDLGTASDDKCISVDYGDSFKPEEEFTIVLDFDLRVTPDVDSTIRIFTSLTGNAANGSSISLEAVPFSLQGRWVFAAFGVSVLVHPTTYTCETGRQVHVLRWKKNETSGQIHVINGQTIATGNAAASTNWAAGAYENHILGAGNTTGSNSGNVHFSTLLVYDRAFSESECKQLSLDLYRAYKPAIETVFFTAGAGGGTSHTLGTDGITAGTTLDTPAVTVDYSLSAPDLTAGTTLDTPAVTIDYSLSALDLTAGTTLDTPTLTTGVTLSVSDLSVSTTLDTPVLTVDYTLSVGDLNVTSTIDIPTVTLDYTLSVADLGISVTIDTPEVSTGINLSAPDLTNVVTLDAPAVTIDYTLGITDLTAGITLDAPTLSAGTLTLTAEDIDAIATAVYNKLVADGDWLTLNEYLALK